MILRSIARACAVSSIHVRRRLTPLYSASSALQPHSATHPPSLPTRRHYAAKSGADIVVEELQELYATAKDEVRWFLARGLYSDSSFFTNSM